MDILNIALDNLNEHTGIDAKWDNHRSNLDTHLILTVNNRELEFDAEVKKEVRMHQIENLLNRTNENYPRILIAERLFPKVKQELRDRKIPYIEGNGNIFIKNQDTWIWIDTNKKLDTNKEKGNRAFTKTGLKVVFHFLLDKELINQTHREIADRVNVGLGNIPQIINGLKETGYLLKLDAKTLMWENRQGLLERWITEYEETLKPGIRKGTYKLRQGWRDLALKPNETVWGGEPAGDILTNHLRPEEFTIYTTETTQDLLKNYQLLPDKKGEITVFNKFWNTEINQKTAPPLLVYADLMATNNKRNRETAQIIYREHIEPNL